jgi:site-specific DNA-methyltransferase (adenine-specific)
VITMLHADCMEYMASVPDKAFDLAIVDPPYGIGAGAESFKNGTSKTEKPYYRKNDWDNFAPDKKYFEELQRVSKNQIIWGGNYFPCLWVNGCRGFIFWDKTIHGNSYADGEMAWTSFDTVARYYRENIAQTNSEGRIHPTQKSIELYKWLLSCYAKPGDRIIDTHGGSGSICVACHDLGYDLTWMELDADYYAAAVARYKAHAAQATLFEPAELTKQAQGELYD